METPPLNAISIREEFLLHSRYIRDTLAPLLRNGALLPASDVITLRSILRKLDEVPMTLELLRYSRIEKALVAIATMEAGLWPPDVVRLAEEQVMKWEDKLGPLKNMRSNLYGLGGRLEGVKKIKKRIDGAKDRNDDTKSDWSVEGALDPARAYRPGHLGFEVGSWWLKPAAAFRDGIIDDTSHGITADNNGAYAVVIYGKQETDLERDGQIKYHAAPNDPSIFKMMKTMMGVNERLIRVLRHWKLQSKYAPKAGLRYDGLYRMVSFGISLQDGIEWHLTFTLHRLSTGQPPIEIALQRPTSDELDDWKEYQRQKLLDRGDDDFGTLRDIVESQSWAKAVARGMGEDLEGDESWSRKGSADSGYYSRKASRVDDHRKSSLASITEVAVEEAGKVVDEF